MWLLLILLIILLLNDIVVGIFQIFFIVPWQDHFHQFFSIEAFFKVFVKYHCILVLTMILIIKYLSLHSTKITSHYNFLTKTIRIISTII